MIKNLKIGARLFLGYLIIFLLLILVSIFSLNRMTYLAGFTEKMYKNPYAVSRAIREVESDLIRMHRGMKDVALSENSLEVEKHVDLVNQFERRVFDNLAFATDKYLWDKSIFTKFKEDFMQWKPIRAEVVAMIHQGQRDKAAAITKQRGAKQVKKLEEELDNIKKINLEKAQDFYNGAVSSKKSSFLVVLLLDLFALALSIFIAYIVTRSITRPLKTAVSVIDQLAEGKISVKIDETSNDEMGLMLESMKRMGDKLQDQMRELIEGISIIAGSASQISSTTAQLASTSQEVASSVNEIVVSMREVKQTTELSNEKAKEMADRSKSVVQVSQNGEMAVRQTIELINAIQEQMMSIADSVVGLSEQSQSIGEIIAAVDDVADQSRLLAVNASIEAVKAGEQGKGFTVVADEIKSLAEQSKQSTSQVRTILTDIQKATSAAVMATEKGSKAVENGVKQADQTGISIQKLGESIIQTSQSAMQIEATSRQQSAGIDQVFTAMENINNAIGQTAESARQLEKSAKDLETLGRKLKTIVDRYNIS